MGLKIAFCQFGTIKARYISRYYRLSGDLILLRNRSKLVEESLLAIIDFLLGAKSFTLCFLWRVGGQKNLILKKFHFFITFNFFHVITVL